MDSTRFGKETGSDRHIHYRRQWVVWESYIGRESGGILFPTLLLLLLLLLLPPSSTPLYSAFPRRVLHIVAVAGILEGVEVLYFILDNCGATPKLHSALALF